MTSGSANELRQASLQSPGSSPSQDRGLSIKIRPRATWSEVSRRSRPKMPFLPFVAWNGGFARYWNGVMLRDLGVMQCKGQVQSWCQVNGVRFLEELP